MEEFPRLMVGNLFIRTISLDNWVVILNFLKIANDKNANWINAGAGSAKGSLGTRGAVRLLVHLIVPNTATDVTDGNRTVT